MVLQTVKVQVYTYTSRYWKRMGFFVHTTCARLTKNWQMNACLFSPVFSPQNIVSLINIDWMIIKHLYYFLHLYSSYIFICFLMCCCQHRILNIFICIALLQYISQRCILYWFLISTSKSVPYQMYYRYSWFLWIYESILFTICIAAHWYLIKKIFRHLHS